MKSMHIDAVINFPFPTPPDRSALKKAEIILTRLGALDVVKGKGGTGDSVVGGHVTDLGRAMSIFPVSPRFSKMIVSGRQHGCLPYIVAIVSALSVGDPFIREDTLADDELETSGDDSIETPQYNQIRSADLVEKERRKATRRAFFKSQEVTILTDLPAVILTPDILKLHSSLGKGLSDAFRILSVVGAYEYAGGGSQFCAEHFVRPKVR
jgi:ATP-dependent RNA helicase DHX37/DHR1